jgi:hypothetical protein
LTTYGPRRFGVKYFPNGPIKKILQYQALLRKELSVQVASRRIAAGAFLSTDILVFR